MPEIALSADLTERVLCDGFEPSRIDRLLEQLSPRFFPFISILFLFGYSYPPWGPIHIFTVGVAILAEEETFFCRDNNFEENYP
jgi:hypothetical protein